MATFQRKEYKGLCKTARVFFILQAVIFAVCVLVMIVFLIVPGESSVGELLLIPLFLIFYFISTASMTISFFAMRMSTSEKKSKRMFWISVAMLGVVSCFAFIFLVLANSLNN